jgi:Flp pilus assembly pilin Flp
MTNDTNHTSRAQRPGPARAGRKQLGSAAIEYLVVTSLAVITLVIAADGETPLANLANAVIGFYSDFSYAISMATP